MKLKIYTLNKAATGNMDLPKQFSELIRPDLVKRAVEVVQTNKRQPYGAKPKAGMRASAELSRRRRKYRGSYGHGISRVPRKILTRRGTQFFWVGAVAPGTVGGRKAHPPKAEKQWSRKINKKERRKAIRSAMAATVVREIIIKRGHKLPQEFPFIIHDNIGDIKKTKEAKIVLERLGFKDELKRVSKRKQRAGKGKLRGRRYRQKKGPLVVVSKKCALLKTAKNIAGVDVVEVQNLNTELLAPGADIGRLTLYTQGTIERLAKEGLFMKNYKGISKRKIKEQKKETIKKKIEAKKEAKKQKKKKSPAKKAAPKKKVDAKKPETKKK